MTSVTEEMIEALKPFVENVPEFDAAIPDSRDSHGWTFQVRDFRRARAALEAALSASPAARTEPVALEGDDTDRMWKISKLIEELQYVLERYGDTCVYIRRGGLAWGAVALNRRADDEKHGVFDLQATHDLAMAERLEQVQRLIDDRNSWRRTAERLEAEKQALASPSAPQPTEPVAGILGAQDLASAAASLLEVFADQFKASDDTASWSMASVMAEKIRAALVSPVAQQRDEVIEAAANICDGLAAEHSHEASKVYGEPEERQHWRAEAALERAANAIRALSPERKDQSHG